MVYVDVSSWVLFFARVVLASVMLYYGFPKVRNLRANADDFRKMGFSPGWLWGTIVAAVEFCGGIILFFGLYAEVAAALFGFQMAVGALWKIAKMKKAFPDYSYDLELLALSLVILAFGGGAFTVRPFRAFYFLRWYSILGALVLVAAFVFFSRPEKEPVSE